MSLKAKEGEFKSVQQHYVKQRHMYDLMTFITKISKDFYGGRNMPVDLFSPDVVEHSLDPGNLYHPSHVGRVHFVLDEPVRQVDPLAG